MKKVVLLLGLTILAVGSIQSQGVQVRKVFAHNISNYVNNLSIDTSNGRYVIIADLSSGSAPARIAIFDSIGERWSLPVLGGWAMNWPDWSRKSSRNGRYFAVPQAGGIWKAMDKWGDTIPEFPRIFEQVLLVSDDGSRWLGIRRHAKRSGGRDVPRRLNIEHDPSDTLVLMDKKGKVVAQIAAPGLTYAQFSPKRNWLFIRYTNYVTEAWALACYDNEGRRKWYKEGPFYPLFQADSLNNLCVLEMRKGRAHGLAFYSPSGQEQDFVPLLDSSIRLQYPACELGLSKDGKYAAFNGDKHGLFFVQKTPPRVLWSWQREPIENGHPIFNTAISEWGDYVVAQVNDVARTWGHIYLFNKSGEVVWKGSDIQKGAAAHLSFGIGDHFAAHTGNAEVTLFEIKP